MTQLRRGYGRHWCPACSRWKGETEMTDVDPVSGERQARMVCKTCSLSSSKANRKALAVTATGRLHETTQ
ncbi:hypothetical protein MHM84_01120 [Halomonas sp. McH1-25]|uniref:hypothetical protein n=1 Tax=unclassified Halomonas TaxID=2609666 RepID=UPI001EF45BD4|nr:MULTISPECIES: hypothetical protein [unclassified Halomonas]MCG7598382.1 hypothetical protein [Halomonas sp. McH1-25]MCP1342676.1 hypothetical protein [Halomonas sp. FL8]MCP1362556.1 hypothetical protein [Halomonas sp. BBD45]MCP1363722.1 hypothetical protein [Halomonas sp. BBD48]